jgi:hypothetical protein
MNDKDRVACQPWSTDSGCFDTPPRSTKPTPARQLEDGTWVGYAPSHVPWMEVLHSEALAGRHNAQMETLTSVMERGSALLEQHKQRDS